MVPPTQPSSGMAVLVVRVNHFLAIRACPSAGIRTCETQTLANGRALELRADRALQVQTHKLGAYLRLLAQLFQLMFACART